MIDVKTLSPQERKLVEARRDYMKKWRKANKEKVQQHQKKFFEKLSAQKEAQNNDWQDQTPYKGKTCVHNR